MSAIEKCGNAIEHAISSACCAVGNFVGHAPRKTMVLAVLLALVFCSGFLTWETENRGEKLLVPQGSRAQDETDLYDSYFPGTARFQRVIFEDKDGGNALVKNNLVEALKLHLAIEKGVATITDENANHEEGDDNQYDLVEVCVRAGGSCVSETAGVCGCQVSSIFRQWNYRLETLENDNDVLATIASYGSQADLDAVLGEPVFNSDGRIQSAKAFAISYFLRDRSYILNAQAIDPINEGWEGQVFLEATKQAADSSENVTVMFYATRSFGDEFGSAISDDLALIPFSYIIAFVFLGANMGRILCRMGSRWTMAFAALATVGLSTIAGFGLSSLFGLFYSPVHSLLPFVVLGIGVDDAFVIVNAFDRERSVPRTSETNEDLAKRTSDALGRAGASITVTSMTDLVAFAISTSSALPALAHFCGFASITIMFLWIFASTFFTACLVLDERRQRDNRRECLCCLTRRSDPLEEDDDGVYKEELIARYFRNYHAPAILSPIGKIIVFVAFSVLLGFGINGALNLSVEDPTRNFIPRGSYMNDFFDANDFYFPSQGIEASIIFENTSQIYASRAELADLETRLSGLSGRPPYIAEPISNEVYKNVMDGLGAYLAEAGTANDLVGGVTLGDDGWPTTESDFVGVLRAYASPDGPGAFYAPDVSFNEDGNLRAIKVNIEYVRLTKISDGETIDDAGKQVDAMDATRDLVNSWDDLPPATPFSTNYLSIEGFKIMRRELFVNVGTAIAAVCLIVLLTVPSPVAAGIISINVASCIVEILGFMNALGVSIDFVSVINIVLAIGLSVDYSAHIGHCFMLKGGDDKNSRVTESLADIGTAVMNGCISTALAVVVLLNSQSYIFYILSRQFMITVILGASHGLILLPVMLSVLGPKPFASAEEPGGTSGGEGADDESTAKQRPSDAMKNGAAGNNNSSSSSSSSNNN